MGVVVVVPAFAAGEQRDPPAVAGVVAGFKAAAAPHVGGGVDQPGGVQAERDAQQNAPQNHGDAVDEAAPQPSAAEQEHAAGHDGKPMIFAQPDVEAVAAEVGRVAQQRLSLRVQGLAEEQPAGVRPPSAFAGSVRIAFAGR